MTELAIDLRGIAETLRGLRLIEKGISTEVTSELRAIAGEVVGKSREIAEQKGLRRSGALIAGIRPGVRSGGAVIRETAVRETGLHAPYKYPGVYEFGGRTGLGQVGPRAFLQPAIDEMRTPAYHRVEAAIDRLINKASF